MKTKVIAFRVTEQQHETLRRLQKKNGHKTMALNLSWLLFDSAEYQQEIMQVIKERQSAERRAKREAKKAATIEAADALD